MPHSNDFRGDQESFPNFPEKEDCFDQAIEEILGKQNPSAYSVFTAIERMVRQFKLDTEAHGLLFEAYLRGKKALQQGKEIRKPQAWLKGVAYNIAREKYRKGKKTHTYSPDIIDAVFHDESDSPMDVVILEEEIMAVFEAVCRLRQENPATFALIHQRIVEGLSWQEIKANYERENEGEVITEVTLRKRFSRGRKYLRSIFHEVVLAQ